MRKTFLTFVTLAVVAVLAGCASIGRAAFRQPVVSFKDLRVEGAGLTGATLDVVLGVFNPNGYRLDASKLTYRLLIGETQLAQGAASSPINVRANDSTTVTLPISLDYAALRAAGKQLTARGSVNYRVLGDLTVATPAGNFTIPYDRTARFSTLSGTSR